MKVEVLMVLTCVLIGVCSITVPPVWPTSPTKYRQPNRYYKTHARPGRQNLYRNPPPTPSYIKHKPIQHTDSYWLPVTPNPIQTFSIYTPKSYITQTFPAVTSPRKIIRNYKGKNYSPNGYQTIDYNRVNYIPHADKNMPFSPIRGSYITKIPAYTNGPDDYYINNDADKLPDEEPIKSNYNAPVSEHEIPKDIPTKPVYPGEGQWARPGVKHKPYIDHTKYAEPIKDDTKSDGYDIFERGEERFKKAQKKFKFQKEDSPSDTEESQDLFEDVHKNKEEEFIPQKLYAQVRRTETKKHVPRSEIDPEEDENAARLKEIIKDSKIQTVYSEEGYEDSAYDHGGHHKKAESQNDHSYQGEEYEKLGKKSVGDKKSKHHGEASTHRGRSKYKRVKNKDESSKTEDADDHEVYEDIKRKVEREGDKRTHDSESAGAVNYAIKVPLNKKVGPQRNLQTSKDMKKIEIKSTMRNGDDLNMEIHTEVKFLNGSDKKKQKFVKIVPSYKPFLDDPDDSIEYDDPEQTDHHRVKRYNRGKLSKIFVRKRPNYYWKKTSRFTTGGKKVKAEYATPNHGLSTTFKTKTTTTHTTVSVPVAIKIKKITKRYAVDDPNVEVDDSTVELPDYKFENVANFPEPTPKPDLTHIKYPYFKLKTDSIPKNSPLRYAENPINIPKKTSNSMAFYDSTSNIECPEVEDSVDPIPDRIKNKKSDDPNDEEVENDPPGPRLKGLGDKIDCMKLKYFGEDPLDNPLFTEDEIKVEMPKIFEKLSKKQVKTTKLDKTIGQKLSNHKIRKRSINSGKGEGNQFEPIIVLDSKEEVNPVVTKNPIIQENKAVLKLPYTFKEMVSKILNETNDRVQSKLEGPKESPSKFVIIYKNSSESQEEDNNIKEKIESLSPSAIGYVDPKISDVIPDLGSKVVPSNDIFNLVPENFTEHDLLNPTQKPEEDPNEYETTGALPIYAALISPNDTNGVDSPKYLPIIVPVENENSSSGVPSRRFSSFIFDISKYLPQIKNHKIVTSEVQYKDEIKPSEQMNVYTDVLKSINISTQEIQHDASENSQPITVKLQVPNRSKYPKRRIRIKTTPKPAKHFRPIKRPVQMVDPKISQVDLYKNLIPDTEKITPQVFPTETPATRKPLPENIKNMINQYSPLLINVPDAEYSQEMPDLFPPTPKYYRTIHPGKKIIIQTGNLRPTRHINTYFVQGLRPPPPHQEPFNYNDFTETNRKKREVYEEDDLLAEESELHEIYQSPPKRTYTEIRRPKPQKHIEEDEDEDEEDLRPRKRIYDIKPIQRTTTTEKEPEEYIEIEETTTKRPIVYEKPTGLPDYIKLVDKLHDFWLQNNITTTLPEQETTTANPRATTTTTIKTPVVTVNERRGEPAYLQIINNLHSIRKEIEDQNPTTVSTTTEEEYEPPLEPVKNSNPYLPEPEALTSPKYKKEDQEDVPSYVRNLSSKLRTNIDTSKYKTIERTPVVLRHNFSSRYNAEDEVLPLERMFTTKMPVVYTAITNTGKEQKQVDVEQVEGIDESSKPEIKVEVIVSQSEDEDDEDEKEEEEEVTTTTTTTTVAPSRRQRPRTKPTTTMETSTNPIVRRRRPLRTRLSTTTEASTTQSLIRRRFRQKLDPQQSIRSYVSEIPPNHKREYVPVTEPKDVQPPTDKKKRRLEKTHERRLTSEYTKTSYYDPELQPIEDADKKAEFEIISEIKNPEMKHGGNYYHINDAIRQNERQQENTDVSTERKPIQIKPIGLVISEVPEKQNEWRPIFPNYDPQPTGRSSDLQTEDTTPVYKPKIIKDPSKRMYFYAKL